MFLCIITLRARVLKRDEQQQLVIIIEKINEHANSGNTGSPVTAGTGGRSHGLKLPATGTQVEAPSVATASGTTE